MLAGIGGAPSGVCRGARAGAGCTDDAQCTATAEIVVPLRANGHRHKMRLRVRTTAIDRDSKPGKKARDRLQLICAPATH